MVIYTAGWIVVFIIVLAMNTYIGFKYFKIPFRTSRLGKVLIYLSIHIILIIPSVYYFYLFFNGKTDTKLARFLSYFSAFYLTFLYYTLLFYLLHDIIYLTRNVIPYPEKIRFMTYNLFFGGFLIFFISGAIALTSLLNSRKVVNKNYEVVLDKKESQLDDLNIVFIADAHVGTSVTKENFGEIITNINNLNPDIVILGGDFFDEGTTLKDKEATAENLKNINSKYGIVYIEGNHEYKAGETDEEIANQLSYFINSGITVLRDEVLEIEDKFYIIGRKDKYVKRSTLNDLVKEIKKDLPIILLDHRPNHKESAQIKEIDMQLSGHTHDGQFFSVSRFDFIVSKIASYYAYGHHKVKDLEIIVTSGVGDWGIPSRMGSKREIVNVKIDFE